MRRRSAAWLDGPPGRAFGTGAWPPGSRTSSCIAPRRPPRRSTRTSRRCSPPRSRSARSRSSAPPRTPGPSASPPRASSPAGHGRRARSRASGRRRSPTVTRRPARRRAGPPAALPPRSRARPRRARRAAGRRSSPSRPIRAKPWPPRGRAVAAAGAAPAVLVLGGPRAAAFDDLLAAQDRVLVVTRPGSADAIGALAVAGLPAAGPPHETCALALGAVGRALAAGGLATPAALRRALDGAGGGPRMTPLLADDRPALLAHELLHVVRARARPCRSSRCSSSRRTTGSPATRR